MTKNKTYVKATFKTAAALSASLVLVACDGLDDLDDLTISVSVEDDSIIVEDIFQGDAEVDAGIEAGGPGGCPIVGNLIPFELGPGQCQISGELTESGVLTADQTWFLEGSLQIGTPEIAATLNIEAGTQIRGDNQDVTDYVLVYPGSSLQANGTSANPVQFLSDDCLLYTSPSPRD